MSNENTSKYPILPGCDLIGKGYRVFGNFADSGSTIHPLFKFSDKPEDCQPVQVAKRDFRKLSMVEFTPKPYSSYQEYYGSDIQEYQQTVNSKISLEGTYNFFSGSVDTDFGSDKATSLSYIFCKIYYNLQYYTLRLPPDEEAKRFLIPEVKKAIDTMDPTTLFDTYGTHYINGIVMGGRAASITSIQKNSFTAKSSIQVVAKASLNMYVNKASAGVDSKLSEEVQNFRNNSSENIVTTGGDPALGNNKFKTNPDEWLKSLPDNFAFIDFLDNKSLVGLWTLASGQRVIDLQNAFNEYCRKKQTEYKIDGPLLKYKIVNLTHRQFKSNLMFGGKPLYAYKPDDSEEWICLGQVALSSDKPSGMTLVVKALKEGVAVDVSKWTQVWSGEGAKTTSVLSPTYHTIWRGTANNPHDYVVLSDFFRTNSNNRGPPSKDDVASIKAINKACLVRGKVGDLVWNSQGSGANQEGSVWKILPGEDALVVNGVLPFFVATNGWAKPTSQDREVWFLKASACVLDKY